MSINENTLKNIIAFARDLKFGELVIKIQDSHIVHIEKRERFRVNKEAGPVNS